MRYVTVEEVLTQDESSGRIHQRLRTQEGKLLTFEGCNLDQAGSYKVLTDEEAAAAIERAEPGQLCENEWPAQVPLERLERFLG